jgi:hypothetical protein
VLIGIVGGIATFPHGLHKVGLNCGKKCTRFPYRRMSFQGNRIDRSLNVARWSPLTTIESQFCKSSSFLMMLTLMTIPKFNNFPPREQKSKIASGRFTVAKAEVCPDCDTLEFP